VLAHAPSTPPTSALTRAAISLLALVIPYNARAAATGFDGWEGAFQLLLRGVFFFGRRRLPARSAAS
jgi:hypothetical protein